jgi:hypothetical protein
VPARRVAALRKERCPHPLPALPPSSRAPSPQHHPPNTTRPPTPRLHRLFSALHTCCTPCSFRLSTFGLLFCAGGRCRLSLLFGRSSRHLAAPNTAPRHQLHLSPSSTPLRTLFYQLFFLIIPSFHDFKPHKHALPSSVSAATSFCVVIVAVT